MASAPVSESAVKQELVATHIRMARLYEEHGLFHDAVSEGQTVLTSAVYGLGEKARLAQASHAARRCAHSACGSRALASNMA